MLKNIEIISSVIIMLILIVFLIWEIYIGSTTFIIIGIIMLAFNLYYLVREIKEKNKKNFEVIYRYYLPLKLPTVYM